MSYNTYKGLHPNNDPNLKISENYRPYSGHMLPTDLKNETIVNIKHTRMDEKASFYWDRFYWTHQGNFFKDRHWMLREFFEMEDARTRPCIMIEAGCGVGNAIFPLLETFPLLKGRGFDFAKNAVQVANERVQNTNLGERAHFFVYDLTKDPTKLAFIEEMKNKINQNNEIIQENLEKTNENNVNNKSNPLRIRKNTLPIHNASVSEFLELKDQGDFVTVIFVLSALSPDDFKQAIDNIKFITKPGGIVFVRDYAAADLAQERFQNRQDEHIKIQDNFFARGDGTRAYYFETKEMEALFEGWECISNTIECKNKSNQKRGIVMNRRFIQCKFRKPLE